MEEAGLAIMGQGMVGGNNRFGAAVENRVISTKYGDWKCVTGERVVLSL